MAEDVASSIISVGVGADEIIEEEVARLSAVDSGAGLGLASGSVEDAPAPAPAPPAAVRSPAKLPGAASTGDREAVKYAEWRRRSEESAAKLLSVHDTNMEEMGPDGVSPLKPQTSHLQTPNLGGALNSNPESQHPDPRSR